MSEPDYSEPAPELERRRLHAGEARVAVMRRTYRAPIEDVWDACTTAERLARWYVPVSGEFRVGGRIEQALMGSGEVLVCDPPHRLVVALGSERTDEIELRLTAAADAVTALELRHSTTLDTITVGGVTYDAVFCMGGGYYPRLLALDHHLRGTLPADYEPLRMHLDPAMAPAVQRGSAAMAALLDADARHRQRRAGARVRRVGGRRLG